MSNLNPSELQRLIFQEIRRYSAASIADAALRLLWKENVDLPTEMAVLPWNILLIVKWALRDEQTRIRIGRRITDEEFERLRGGVQELIGKDYLAKKPPIYLMMRSHFPQFDFQRPQGWGFLRWPALVARTDANNASRRQFVQELGLSPEHFMDLAFSVVAALLDGRQVVPRDFFGPLRPAYGASIDVFWNLIALDLPALRRALRVDERVEQPSVRQELYEFPHLKRYPFFKTRGGDFAPWQRMVVARGLEEIVHLRLARLGEKYTRPFSRLFEDYVMELAQAMSPNCVTETEYEAIAGVNATKVEAVIPFGHCNVMVEAKMALFGDDVLLTDNEIQTFNKTKRVREAFKQGWKVGSDIRGADSPLPQCAAADQDYLIVVTSRELGLGSGDQLVRLYPGQQLDFPDDESRRNLPLENIFTMSIITFERLSNAVKKGQIDLAQLLETAVARNKNPGTSAILFDYFMGSPLESAGATGLLMQARRASRQRLALAFGPEVGD
ncbi:MAG: hypothetical protein HYX47_01935 [Burkholderiales bacterium]|nr:hypothetical protein [Burkholderiales bacterium]